MIASVVLQVQLAIFTLGFTYKILHGDLNSGNILLSTTNKLDQEGRRAMKNTSIVSDIRLFERSDFKGSRAAQS